MIYDYIIIDLFNLFYRLNNNDISVKECIKLLIKFIDEETLSHLKKEGHLYIISDPIPKSDLGESKSFKLVSYRKEIVNSYKKNRIYSDRCLKIVSFLLKYYSYRDEKIKLIYSNEYEADDFVEPLIKFLRKNNDNADIALVSTDEDWARYLNTHIYLINKGYDNSFTKQDFYDKYKFYPTIASVILYKAIYGDKSDNILGCIQLKKLKFNKNIRKIAYNYIKYVSENNISIKDVIDLFNKTTFLDVINSKSDIFSNLYLELSASSQKENVIQILLNNISIIRSRLENKDISQYVHWNKYNEKINNFLKQTIFGLNTKSWFGKV